MTEVFSYNKFDLSEYNTMKKLSLYILIICTLFGCGVSGDKFRLKGEFKGIKQGEFYLFSQTGNWDGFDTIRVEDGSFEFEHELNEATILTIQYPNFSQMTVIAEPGKEIEIKGDASNLKQTQIKGTEENEILTQFRIENNAKNPEQSTLAAEAFIKKNSQKLASEAILYQYFINTEKPDYNKINALLKQMQKSQPDNPRLQRLRYLINSFTPKKLRTFSAKDINGQNISSNDFKGKYLLIQFWATWNPLSMDQIFRNKQIYKEHKEKFSLLSISMDGDLKRCKDAVTNDSLPGKHICDTYAFDSPLTNTLGVRFLPSNLLINAQGFIIAKDLEGDELQQKIKQLFPSK